jgi:hypothetical protein
MIQLLDIYKTLQMKKFLIGKRVLTFIEIDLKVIQKECGRFD